MSLRSISWPALSDLVIRTAGDTSLDAMRAFCRDAGEDAAREAIEHTAWLLGGEIDPSTISARTGRAVSTPAEARAFVVALRASLEHAVSLHEARTPPPPRERFVSSAEMQGGGKVRNRRYGPRARHPSADFLGRLSALFGAPRVVQYEGFSYSVVDRTTQLGFEAYTGPSGPAYGTLLIDHDMFATHRQYGPTLDAFDRLLDETPLADCRVAFDGEWELACERGRTYERWSSSRD